MTSRTRTARLRAQNSSVPLSTYGAKRNRSHPLGIESANGRSEAAMPASKRPLTPNDFPLQVEGDKIKKQDGTPVAEAEDPNTAADVAERLNDDEARREENKWSA
jgi:hypothetical protein